MNLQQLRTVRYAVRDKLTEQRQGLELGLLADRRNEPHPCARVVLHELQPAGHLS